MDKLYVLEILKEKQKLYKKDGFNILALFGSYSTSSQTETSDIDILYDVNNTFLEKYKGFVSASKVLQIQEELFSVFNKKVDLTSPSGLRKSIREDILSKAIYV